MREETSTEMRKNERRDEHRNEEEWWKKKSPPNVPLLTPFERHGVRHEQEDTR
jgi:hypothetical protein